MKNSELRVNAVHMAAQPQRWLPCASRYLLPAILLLASTLPAPAAWASDDGPSLSDRFEIFGFLTQGFAKSDGNQVFGISEDGTTDYRNIALQLRFTMTEADLIVVQLNHEAVGEAPGSELQDDIELDWAFYRRTLAPNTHVKAGRMPIPLGIYTEIREVGTVLPFYRPPEAQYGFAGQSAFTLEAVDGVMLSRSFWPDRDWSVDAEIYYGGWDFLEQDGTTGVFSETRATDAFGGYVWLNTPWPGVRFGSGGVRFEIEGLDGITSTNKMWVSSLEAAWKRWLLRAEFMDYQLRFLGSDVDYGAFHVQLGFQINDAWQLWVQRQESSFDTEIPFIGTIDRDYLDETAIALRYSFSNQDVVVRLEWHDQEALQVDNLPINIFGKPFETKYSILSVSVSF